MVGWRRTSTVSHFKLRAQTFTKNLNIELHFVYLLFPLGLMSHDVKYARVHSLLIYRHSYISRCCPQSRQIHEKYLWRVRLLCNHFIRRTIHNYTLKHVYNTQSLRLVRICTQLNSIMPSVHATLLHQQVRTIHMVLSTAQTLVPTSSYQKLPIRSYPVRYQLIFGVPRYIHLTLLGTMVITYRQTS